MALFSRVEHIYLGIQLVQLGLQVGNKSLHHGTLLLVFLRLHLLFQVSDEIDLLLGCFLLANFIVQQVHQVLNFVDLTGDLVLVLVTLSKRLVELIVGFLNLSDCLRGSHQVPGQLFLNSGSRGVHQLCVF